MNKPEPIYLTSIERSIIALALGALIGGKFLSQEEQYKARTLDTISSIVSKFEDVWIKENNQ